MVSLHTRCSVYSAQSIQYAENTRTGLVMWTIHGFSAQTLLCLLSTKRSVCGKQLGQVLLCGHITVSLHTRCSVYSAQSIQYAENTRTGLVMWTIHGFSAQTVFCLLSTKRSVCGKQLGQVLLCGQSTVSLHRRYSVYSAQSIQYAETLRNVVSLTQRVYR